MEAVNPVKRRGSSDRRSREGDKRCLANLNAIRVSFASDGFYKSVL